MRRRTLLRGIGASTAMAIGASASVSAADTTSMTGEATHLSIRDDDGTQRLVPLQDVENLDVTPADACFADCCSRCDCRHCICGACP